MIIFMAGTGFTRRVAITSGLGLAAGPWLPSSAAEAAAVGDPLRVGVLLDTSGPASIHGKRQLLGVQYQASVFGAGGDERMQLVVRDTAGKVDVTTANMKALLEKDRIDAVIGTSMEATTLAAVDLAQAAGVPMIAPTTISPPRQSFVFCCAATTEQVARHLMRSLGRAGMRRVGMLVLDTLRTPHRMENFEKEATASGVRLVAVEQFSATDKLSAPLKALAGASPDAIVPVTPPPFNSECVKELRALRWPGRIYCGPSAGHPAFLETAGDAAEGVRLVTPWSLLGDRVPDARPNGWAIREFVAGFTPRNGPIGAFVGYGADAASMLHHAFFGHRDRNRARENLEHLNYIGVTGNYRMTPANHAGLDDDALTTNIVHHGSWESDTGQA